MFFATFLKFITGEFTMSPVQQSTQFDPKQFLSPEFQIELLERRIKELEKQAQKEPLKPFRERESLPECLSIAPEHDEEMVKMGMYLYRKHGGYVPAALHQIAGFPVTDLQRTVITFCYVSLAFKNR